MYERMLDKSNKPTLCEMIEHCKTAGKLFERFNQDISADHKTESEIRFPYGNSYGWGIKHKLKNKHVCDIFAEKDAFTVMIRLTNLQIGSIYSDLSDTRKKYATINTPAVKAAGFILG